MAQRPFAGAVVAGVVKDPARIFTDNGVGGYLSGSPSHSLNSLPCSTGSGIPSLPVPPRS